MVSEDLEKEIMLNLPLKSLMRFKSVSKTWESIIRREDFRQRYIARSTQRPRMLFLFYQAKLGEDENVLYQFHSVYQEEKPLLPSDQQYKLYELPPPDDDESYTSGDDFSALVEGLICFRSRSMLTLYNPCTGVVKAVPELQDDMGAKINNLYLGYDECNSVHKVLCMANIIDDEAIARSEYQVFTVGSDSWRPILSKDPHIPVTNGVCIGGVLYYGASHEFEHVLMSFKVTSEEFTSFKLPMRFFFYSKSSLVNYFGEIGMVDNYVSDRGELRIWVMNETSGEWREEHIVIPGWMETMRYFLIGTIGTGELVFGQKYFKEGSYTVLYYDKDEERLQKFSIEGVVVDSCHYVRTFLNHVDTPSFPNI